MSVAKFFHLHAYVHPNQVTWLESEAARRGLSMSDVLRRTLDFAMSMEPSASNAVGWLPHESIIRDRLANDHGLVLSKLGVDRFAVRCANETIKINRRKAASFFEIQAFIDALETSIHGREMARKGNHAFPEC
jgi:hypothetical protein